MLPWTNAQGADIGSDNGHHKIVDPTYSCLLPVGPVACGSFRYSGWPWYKQLAYYEDEPVPEIRYVCAHAQHGIEKNQARKRAASRTRRTRNSLNSACKASQGRRAAAGQPARRERRTTIVRIWISHLRWLKLLSPCISFYCSSISLSLSLRLFLCAALCAAARRSWRLCLFVLHAAFCFCF